MPQLFRNIFFIFSLSGMCSLSLHAAHIAVAETTFIEQQTPVQKDDSYVEPKKYDADFKERYASEEFEYNQEQKEAGWLSNFGDWLEATVQDWFDFGTRKEASEFIQNALNIFYVIIIILVVFFIVKTMMNGEGRWVFGKRSDRRIIRHEDIDTNIHSADFNKLIQEATANGDYRLAIRYQYLNMLKQLSAAEIIAFDPEKTNLDYTYEIKEEALREQFQYTSYVYNYVWYGEFDINQAQYEKAQESFTVVLKKAAA
ncbi:hypothetical protein C8N46_103134 [Kordia periserrulae]|uniref:Protein-glutamine gamma-glutamyltransferase-like C-terminal domain-containing protein n=1 Tax=Kordia periserrulae TaxID=701523 RepID=A0A2T6C142_9FLAO|nr:hypothetical protein [Kordia periserrulae]PTX62036.1 hypothetical protein C8N46_103134 [Kordia periserrulae]